MANIKEMVAVLVIIQLYKIVFISHFLFFARLVFKAMAHICRAMANIYINTYVLSLRFIPSKVEHFTWLKNNKEIIGHGPAHAPTIVRDIEVNNELSKALMVSNSNFLQ